MHEGLHRRPVEGHERRRPSNTGDLLKLSYRIDKRLSEYLSEYAVLPRKVVSAHDASSCITTIGAAAFC